MTESQFTDIVMGMADGMEYVRQRFHHLPSAFCVTDASSASSPTLFYSYEHDTIFLPRPELERLTAQKIPLLRQGKTEPLLLPFPQMYRLGGVEEAYHAYQLNAHPDKARFLQTAIHHPNGTYNHDNAIEQDAAKLVREAMHDMGMPLYSLTATARVAPDAAAWYRREQAEIQKSWAEKVEPAITQPLQR